MKHTPDSIQRRSYTKTFITSVFRDLHSGADTWRTGYKFEYEYEKRFITSGPELVTQTVIYLFKEVKYVILYTS